jgi:hypothetical protein
MGSREVKTSLLEWDPVVAVYDFISTSAFISSDKPIVAALHSDVIRLRVWKRELFIDGLAGYEAQNPDLMRLVQICIENIKITLEKVIRAASLSNISAVE